MLNFDVIVVGGGHAGCEAAAAAARRQTSTSASARRWSLVRVSDPCSVLGCGAAAVIASYGGQDYPTNAVWNFSSLSALPDAVRAGTGPRSLKRVAGASSAIRLDYSAITDFDPFRNANTPQDLAFLRHAYPAEGRD